MLDDIAPLYDPTTPPRVVTLAEAERLGWTESAVRHEVRTGRWQRLLPRTYLTSDTLLWPDKLTAAVKFAGPQAFVSGAAALADRGLTCVQRPSRILVIVPAGRAPRSARWVQIRPSARPVAPSLAPGVPRVTDARAVTDVAVERRRQDDVRALVTEAVRRQLCTVEELAAELRHVPRRGSGFLRRAVDEAGDGAWSAPEARAAGLLRAAGLPDFEQNARLELPDGRWLYVDFLWRRLRAVLEIDSDAHHAFAGAADRTSDRHLILSTLGFSVVHRTPRLVVREPQDFVAGIGAWLAAREHELYPR